MSSSWRAAAKLNVCPCAELVSDVNKSLPYGRILKWLTNEHKNSRAMQVCKNYIYVICIASFYAKTLNMASMGHMLLFQSFIPRLGPQSTTLSIRRHQPLTLRVSSVFNWLPKPSSFGPYHREEPFM
jgi:hypothetical protein